MGQTTPVRCSITALGVAAVVLISILAAAWLGTLARLEHAARSLADTQKQGSSNRTTGESGNDRSHDGSGRRLRNRPALAIAGI